MLQSRVVRYQDLVPCLNAFVDTRTPGSDKKENFTIVGPGVSENPDQHVHIPEAHGFNIGGARQPPGCLNSQHSHLTAEVFVVHSGEWVFRYGVDATDGKVRLSPGDTISIPTNMFRGFENVGDDVGFLFAVLGGDDPGNVTWAPRVFELAADYGLVLLQGGKLVDTTVGETVPAGAVEESPPDASEIQRLATPASERLTGCVACGPADGADDGTFGGVGIAHTLVISDDAAAGAQIRSWWPHEFSLHRLVCDAGAATDESVVATPEVIFVHEGVAEVRVDGETLSLSAGDTFSVPVGSLRAISAGNDGAQVFVVQGES